MTLEHLAAENERLAAENRRLRSELERIRPVYEAAVAWRPHRARDVIGTAPTGGPRTATGVALIDAIDAALARKVE